ncbi:hypothetical protein Slin15195_G024630 [Septoria linicola]|uniref:Uncharacterized protein n=1 Tax=Septoria linicola TaxID=215465 RepID=A0A9Q9AGT7_9PEZI|nr:hypothetical protein Slin14017_G023720 [Septoria linicola]USW49144.1 hypothetical protein Slin15195_G024630 [Septoria linicola]
MVYRYRYNEIFRPNVIPVKMKANLIAVTAPTFPYATRQKLHRNARAPTRFRLCICQYGKLPPVHATKLSSMEEQASKRFHTSPWINQLKKPLQKQLRRDQLPQLLKSTETHILRPNGPRLS